MSSIRFPLVAFLLAFAGSVEAASPALSVITPRGVQRGAENEVIFRGGRLADAVQILFNDPGFEVTALEAKDDHVKVKVKVAPNTRMGEHYARIRTKTGVSEIRNFFVGPFPAVAEVEPNTEFDKPQKIGMNVTVTGVVENEDVDYFLVEAKKGQRISAEVEGMRLANAVFDPYVAIMNMERFELAAMDDLALLSQDAAASVIAPADGTYVVQVRDSSYAGNGGCMYRLHVGNFPRPTAVYPAGGKVSQEVEVKFLGDPSGEFTQKFKLPDQPKERFGLEPLQNGAVSPSPNSFRVSPFDHVMEAEPNNELAQGTPAAADLPLAFNGIIATKGDVDCFKFKAKKDQQLDIHCYARRVRSPLDSVLNLYYADGRGIAGNDDSAGPDSYIRFGVPADGEYIIRITDHLGKGAADYTFRVEITPVQPSTVVNFPQYARYSQVRHEVAIPKGNRYAQLVNISRQNWGGDVLLTAVGLPKGVTMVTDKVPAGLSQFPVVFEAAPDAEVTGNWGTIVASPADPNLKIPCSFYQRYEAIIGPPGQSVYCWTEMEQVPFAVTDEAPFKIDIVEPKVPLVHNGSMNLKIVAKRKDGFVAPINVEFPFRPPGVGAASSVTIPQGQNEVYYPLNANGGAPVGDWKVYALGYAENAGTVYAASQLATLKIAAPYVNVAIQMAATEQGQPTEVVCQLTHTTPFEGAAKIQLIGLPAQCATKELEITKDSKEVVFPVTVDKASPVGQHKTLFCQLVVVQNTEPILHTLGHGGVIRIDAPPPPKPNTPPPMPVAQAAPAAAKAAPPPEQPAKRLTRLEKLRLEQAERAKAASGGGQ